MTTSLSSAATATALQALKPSPRMPVLFVGHGSPMNAIEDNAWRRSWQAMGAELMARAVQPQLILCVSAHWLTRGWQLTARADTKIVSASSPVAGVVEIEVLGFELDAHAFDMLPLRQAHARGARMLSICSGVFVLAATDLLDGHGGQRPGLDVEQVFRVMVQRAPVPDQHEGRSAHGRGHVDHAGVVAHAEVGHLQGGGAARGWPADLLRYSRRLQRHCSPLLAGGRSQRAHRAASGARLADLGRT